ncbi:uncharacterized protein LOC133179705 [Saccostrea echinata]|uniref:uncharacterized protein LOC133179705 n=1 Tax=Saccostrea echinata TaxID=191078 RepID=UPI002A810619|nr:uncharacterized protein LOC133179705 [Saccostrea echinata]
MARLYRGREQELNAQAQLFFQKLKQASAGSRCKSESISCLPAPWCHTVTDVNGCHTCTCNRSFRYTRETTHASALSPFSASMFGKNGGFGFPGFPSFSGQMGPMNPMAAMLGSGSSMSGAGSSFPGMGNPPMSGQMGFPGAMSPMGGFMGQMNPMSGAALGLSNQKTPIKNQTSCDPAPYTCLAPPPWCQRIIDEEGCTKCLCGNDLEAYYDKLQGATKDITTGTPTSTVNQTNTTVTSRVSPTTTSTITAPTTTIAPPLGKACLANFFCTLDCRTGYQTDPTGCPLCSCNDDINDVVTQGAPIPDSSTTQVPLTTLPISVSSSPAGISVVCPGIFDCMKQCMNGYQVDAQGCPLCQCI